MTALDSRLLAGMRVTLTSLAGVFADHYASDMAACTACGYEPDDGSKGCPSRVTARALLARRRNERPEDVPDWIHAELDRRGGKRGAA